MNSFYNSAKVIHNIQHDLSGNHCINKFVRYQFFYPCETSPSIGNNLQTPIRESSITNSEVPENQINIENSSDNSAFKENTQHIHTNIDTFKSNTFRKLPSLRLNLMLSKLM